MAWRSTTPRVIAGSIACSILLSCTQSGPTKGPDTEDDIEVSPPMVVRTGATPDRFDTGSTDTGVQAALPVFLSAPELTENTVQTPLVRWVSAETDVPTTLVVELFDGTLSHVQTFGPATVHEHLILGVMADRNYEVRISAKTDDDLATPTHTIPLTTSPLPWELQSMRLRHASPTQMEPGMTLITVGNFIVLLDLPGNVVWFHNVELPLTESRRASNGNLTYLVNHEQMVEIDLAGNTLQRWLATGMTPSLPGDVLVDIETPHHDFVETVGGNKASLSAEMRWIYGYPASYYDETAREDATVVADVIVEFDSTGQVVSEINMFDLFPTDRIGFDSIGRPFWYDFYAPYRPHDWTHANALYYDSQHDEYIISLRQQDAVVSISRATGEIVWIFAPDINWPEELRQYLLTPVAGADEFIQPYHQHGVELTPSGNILVFDNGNHRASPPQIPLPDELNTSRAAEFAVDRVAMTVAPVWSYGLELDPPHFATKMGDADWLPQTGNVMMLMPAIFEPEQLDIGVRLIEVTHADPPEVVFDVAFPAYFAEVIYRAHRVPAIF